MVLQGHSLNSRPGTQRREGFFQRLAGFSVAEVAKTFGISVSNAESLGDFRYKILHGVAGHVSGSPTSILTVRKYKYRLMSSTHDERQLLLEGGLTTLASMFSSYRDRLERIVNFRLDPRIRGRIDAADILQEAYLEVADRLQSFLDSADVSFFVWLRQQTLQTLADVHRRHFRQKRDVNREIRFSSTGAMNDTSLSIAQFLIGQLTSPSQIVANAEEMQSLQESLNSMNEVDREVLALRHFEQLGNAQVAEILDLSPTAASNRYLRAAARLSEIMQRLNPKTGPVN